MGVLCVMLHSLEPRPSTQFSFAAVEKSLIFFHGCEKNCVEGLGSRLTLHRFVSHDDRLCNLQFFLCLKITEKVAWLKIPGGGNCFINCILLGIQGLLDY